MQLAWWVQTVYTRVKPAPPVERHFGHCLLLCEKKPEALAAPAWRPRGKEETNSLGPVSRTASLIYKIQNYWGGFINVGSLCRCPRETFFSLPWFLPKWLSKRNWEYSVRSLCQNGAETSPFQSAERLEAGTPIHNASPMEKNQINLLF